MASRYFVVELDAGINVKQPRAILRVDTVSQRPAADHEPLAYCEATLRIRPERVAPSLMRSHSGTAPTMS